MADDQEEDDAGGIPEWVVTFGDMMSLLLTFFIMLVSLSEIKEEEKYQALVESIKRQLGHARTEVSMTPGDVRPRNSAIQKLSSQGRSRRLDTMRGGQPVEAAVGEEMKVRVVRNGSRTVIGTSISFLEGSPTIPPDELGALRTQARQFLGNPQMIDVRGHTSRRPLAEGSDFTDHDGLAFERCRRVKAFLVEEFGIEPARIRITVAGQHDPVYRGTDPEELLANPRVEVFELDEVLPDQATGVQPQ